MYLVILVISSRTLLTYLTIEFVASPYTNRVIFRRITIPRDMTDSAPELPTIAIGNREDELVLDLVLLA